MLHQPPASHFVDGDYLEDEQGEALPVIFPGTGEQIAALHEATPAVLERALESAERAQRQWAQTPPVERGRVLRRAAELIRERNQELSELETWDTGKAIQETLVADACSAADALEFFGGVAATINGETMTLGDDWVYTRREPLGVCLGIGAWNYPCQIAGWKAAPALACGNAMVYKPSEFTPLTTLKLAGILCEAGAPAGLFNVVQGGGAVGAKLSADQRIAKISFTGSVASGQKVYAAAALGTRALTLELGGKSPLLVFEDADLDNAVSGIMLANFYSSGQVCTNGTRVFVQSSVAAELVERLVARVEAIRIGDPRDPETQMGPMISEQQRQIVLDYVAQGLAEGAELRCGGQALPGPGAFISPAVFTKVTDHMSIAREEIFGPVASILEFADEAEAIARANSSSLGLASGVFTQDINRAHRVAAALEAGMCWINSYNLTPVEAPFGGAKSSGLGRENSRAALEYYTQVKTIYVAMGPVESPY